MKSARDMPKIKNFDFYFLGHEGPSQFTTDILKVSSKGLSNDICIIESECKGRRWSIVSGMNNRLLLFLYLKRFMSNASTMPLWTMQRTQSVVGHRLRSELTFY